MRTLFGVIMIGVTISLAQASRAETIHNAANCPPLAGVWYISPGNTASTLISQANIAYGVGYKINGETYLVDGETHLQKDGSTYEGKCGDSDLVEINVMRAGHISAGSRTIIPTSADFSSAMMILHNKTGAVEVNNWLKHAND